MNSDIDYKQKYLKYKAKYYKEKINGGSLEKMVGPSSSASVASVAPSSFFNTVANKLSSINVFTKKSSLDNVNFVNTFKELKKKITAFINNKDYSQMYQIIIDFLKYTNEILDRLVIRIKDTTEYAKSDRIGFKNQFDDIKDKQKLIKKPLEDIITKAITAFNITQTIHVTAISKKKTLFEILDYILTNVISLPVTLEMNTATSINLKANLEESKKQQEIAGKVKEEFADIIDHLNNLFLQYSKECNSTNCNQFVNSETIDL